MAKEREGTGILILDDPLMLCFRYRGIFLDLDAP